MSKLLTEDWANALSLSPTTLAVCWRIERRDGTVYCFTSAVRDLVMADSAFLPYGILSGSTERTYRSSAGISPSEVNESAGSAPANLNIEFLVEDSSPDEGVITMRDIRAGLFDGADVLVFTVNYMDLTMGPFEPWRGYLGDVSKENSLASVEVNSLARKTEQEIGMITGETCRWRFGSEECGVDLSGTNPDGVPYTWEGQTVASASSRHRFVAASLNSDLDDAGYSDPSGTLSLSGRVTTALGFPLRGLTIKATQGGSEVDSTTTDSDGSFSLSVATGSETTLTPSYAGLGFSPATYTIAATVTRATRSYDFYAYVAGQSAPSPPPAGGLSGSAAPAVTPSPLPGNFFNRGRVIWTSGANSGLQGQVQSYDHETGEIVLWNEMPEAIAANDEFTIVAGCEHTHRACWQDHSNAANYGGEVRGATNETVLRVGGSEGEEESSGDWNWGR